ncbi:transmembrane 220 family protein [Parapedobacter tibetensis]|uniref:transmembrane 220 family protein n=1 Tax=Parapedobacter tibetensis TaxID=2972951 RepID=UPI00214D8193|nr:transmembrane 220 family protein [Parapedobacter tibetensis]
MKAFNIICSILFVLSAALQYNDEDPYIWIPIYLYGALLCYLAARKKYLPKAYLLGIVVYLGYAAYLLFFSQGVIDWFQHHPTKDLVQSMKADKPWIEETRELGGLLILIVTLAINWFVGWKRKRITTR